MAKTEKTDSVYSVGDLTHFIKFLLEKNEVLSNVSVTGEISNLTKHSSGHVYFTLKDADAQLRCAMFKGVAMRYYRNLPQQGHQVTLRGAISLYAPRGEYQLIVSEIRQEGKGDLHEKFLALKEKLEKEGLFDPRHKKPLPTYPERLGIVTSPTGAALQDMLLTLERLWPHLAVMVAPAQVQGDGSAASVASALSLLDQHGKCDTIILARGGGSLEDLWTFNEEQVARAIFACNTPVISGVGHETDFTIADFVADKRASTPTAAAEMSVPDSAEFRERLNTMQRQLSRSLQHFIDFRRQWLDDYGRRMENAILSRIRDARHDLEKMELRLAAVDVRQVLSRGFTVTTHNGKRITQASALSSGDIIETFYLEGKTTSRIEKQD